MSDGAGGGKERWWVTVLVYVVLLALPLALVVGGASMLYERQVGSHARATVTDCQTTRHLKVYSQTCTGTWTFEGRRMTGTVQNADPGDVGHTIDVTVDGDEATSTSLVLPVVLILLGLPFLVLLLWSVSQRPRGRARPTSP